MDFRRFLLDGILIILILIIIILIIFNIVLSKNKTGFTELYFIGDLPKTVEINKTYSFSFGIHNFEYKITSYNYELYLQSKKIGQGQVFLEHNEIAVVNQSFIVRNKTADNPTLVSVRLLNKEQEIHFWVS